MSAFIVCLYYCSNQHNPLSISGLFVCSTDGQSAFTVVFCRWRALSSTLRRRADNGSELWYVPLEGHVLEGVLRDMDGVAAP